MTLYIFDKDGTLVGVPDPAVDRPANTPEEQVLLPNVKAEISYLRRQGHKIAIASNQGGVAWGFITLAQADALLRDCARKIGNANAYEFCPHDDRKNTPCECRKPRPGMLLSLMRRFKLPPSDCVMVGDRESDYQAAIAAGCEFEWAADFFNWR